MIAVRSGPSLCLYPSKSFHTLASYFSICALSTEDNGAFSLLYLIFWEPFLPIRVPIVWAESCGGSGRTSHPGVVSAPLCKQCFQAQNSHEPVSSTTTTFFQLSLCLASSPPCLLSKHSSVSIDRTFLGSHLYISRKWILRIWGIKHLLGPWDWIEPSKSFKMCWYIKAALDFNISHLDSRMVILESGIFLQIMNSAKLDGNPLLERIISLALIHKL